MATSFLRNLLKRRRKYPIKRDRFRKSARRRVFELFDRNLRPAQVSLPVTFSSPILLQTSLTSTVYLTLLRYNPAMYSLTS
jgi:hypothetical protein